MRRAGYDYPSGGGIPLGAFVLVVVVLTVVAAAIWGNR